MQTITDPQQIATDSIHRIREALTTAEEALNYPTFETGLLGLSLFYSYYAQFTGNDDWYRTAEQYLERGLDKLNDLSSYKRIYSTDSLDCHLSNVGRFLEFSKKHQLLDIDTNDFLGSMDGTLAKLMTSKIDLGDFDLNSGAFAGGYYFLSRYPSDPSLAKYCVQLLQGIEEKAQQDEEGDYYWTSPSLFNKVFFGISHGSGMIILFLANLYDLGIEPETCRRIAQKAASFIIKHKRTQENGLFPLSLGDHIESSKPFCLCYGDIGTGYALYHAARITGDEAIRAIADEVLNASLARQRTRTSPADASLIYGASGVAALFEKLYLFSHDERHREAARHWYEQIPTYAIYGDNYAGYKTMLDQGNDLWNTSMGWGIVGIGLSLMRYVRPALPPFYELLMIA